MPTANIVFLPGRALKSVLARLGTLRDERASRGRPWKCVRLRDASSVCGCCSVWITSRTDTVELVSSVTTSMHGVCAAAL